MTKSNNYIPLTPFIKGEFDLRLHDNIAINNKYLEDLGLKLGDKVCFRPNSEYEFKIDDEKVYRVRCRNVTIKL